MTEEETRETVSASERHIGGNFAIRAIPYACPGGFAVVAPVVGQPGLSYILTEYHVNIFEELGAMAAAPPVVRLFRRWQR